jgi:F-type H+-transporting ATPase subunit a
MAGAAHYTYFDSLGIHDQNTQKVLTAVTVALGVYFLLSRGVAALNARRATGDHIIPDEKISVGGLFDWFIESFANLQDSVLGKENRQYLPLTGTIFLSIFSFNLLSLIPGFPAAATTVWVSVAIALVIFFSFNTYGIREHGVVGYFKHFLGPVWWLAALMLPLELLSVSLRILTLNLRLYWNITADHLVLGIFTQLTGYIVPVIFLVLGTFISFVQAFVPTILTMVYILLAIQHAEEEHH